MKGSNVKKSRLSNEVSKYRARRGSSRKANSGGSGLAVVTSAIPVLTTQKSWKKHRLKI